MVPVNACISVSGVRPRCWITSFTHTPWAPVEPNATGPPSESLYVTAVRVIHVTIVRVEVFKHCSIEPSIYRYLKPTINSVTAFRSCFKFHIGLLRFGAVIMLVSCPVRGWRACCGRGSPRGWLKEHSRCGVLGVAPNAPKPDEAPSGMRGKEDEAMT